jgi:hypothetical protein
MMDELQIGAGSPELFPPAIVGEAEAGQAAKVRKQVNSLIKTITTSTFDVMDLLHEVKSKKYYSPKYDTFMDYAKTLDLKVAKIYYLVRVKETMSVAGIDRATYEPIGISKLRTIASIKVVDSENKVDDDAVEMVKTLIQTAPLKTGEELETVVNEYNGNVGDDAFEWLNLKMKKAAKDVIRQALSLIKMQLGSVGKDDDGVAKDASDSAALEKLAMDYLADPNNAEDIAKLGSNEPTEVIDEPVE